MRAAFLSKSFQACTRVLRPLLTMSSRCFSNIQTSLSDQPRTMKIENGEKVNGTHLLLFVFPLDTRTFRRFMKRGSSPKRSLNPKKPPASTHSMQHTIIPTIHTNREKIYSSPL